MKGRGRITYLIFFFPNLKSFSQSLNFNWTLLFLIRRLFTRRHFPSILPFPPGSFSFLLLPQGQWRQASSVRLAVAAAWGNPTPASRPILTGTPPPRWKVGESPAKSVTIARPLQPTTDATLTSQVCLSVVLTV